MKPGRQHRSLSVPWSVDLTDWLIDRQIEGKDTDPFRLSIVPRPIRRFQGVSSN
jgi:hypothetical protein